MRRFAIKQHRVLVTLDADFATILRFPKGMSPGVIWLKPWPPTERSIATLLTDAVARLADISIEGKLVVAEPGRIRIR